MGVIKDIVDIIVPNAQRRIEKGTNSKEALYRELEEIGYWEADKMVSSTLNNITNEEINKQGERGVDIFCEECGYKTGFMTLKSAVFKINMHGGYFMYDGEGGSESKCPICGSGSLIETE